MDYKHLQDRLCPPRTCYLVWQTNVKQIWMISSLVENEEELESVGRWFRKGLVTEAAFWRGERIMGFPLHIYLSVFHIYSINVFICI